MVGIVNKVYCENMIGCMCYYFPNQGYSLCLWQGNQSNILAYVLLHDSVSYKKAT